MNRVILVGLILLAGGLCVYGGPQYYVYNLAATGVANADADIPYGSPGWFGFHGGAGLAEGNFTVNLAARTSDPTLTGNQYLQNVPFSVGGTNIESWSGNVAAGQTSNQASISLSNNGGGSMSIANAQVVFLMMNTFWGTTGQSAEVHLRFSEGGEQVFRLYGNSDVRDHNDAISQGYAGWTNTINSNLHGTAGQQRATVNEATETFRYSPTGNLWTVYRDVVMLFVDPQYASRHLSQIMLIDTGSYPHFSWPQDLNASRLWLWGVTVAFPGSDIPEPSTWMMLAGGLCLAALKLRRR